MDKFFDRIGFYDFFGIVFPGLVATMFSYFAYRYILEKALLQEYSTIEVAVIIMLSYFMGILLHESSNKFQKNIFFGKGEPDELFLSVNAKIFNAVEKEVLVKAFTKKFGEKYVIPTKENSLFIFQYCKTFLINNELISFSEKKQTLSGMSRSLCLFFLIVSIVLPIGVVYCNLKCIEYSLINAVSCELLILISLYLFFRRTKRFAESRVKDIIRAYIVEYDKESDIFNQQDTNIEV